MSALLTYHVISFTIYMLHLIVECVKPKLLTVDSTVCPLKNGPLSIMPYYSEYWANISEIFTTAFSTYLYIVCKNS